MNGHCVKMDASCVSDIRPIYFLTLLFSLFVFKWSSGCEREPDQAQVIFQWLLPYSAVFFLTSRVPFPPGQTFQSEDKPILKNLPLGA